MIMYKKFANLLVKNNKTAYQVSKDTGIAQSVLSDWKTGRSTPKFDKLFVLAKYFDVPVEYFAEDSDEKGA
jgi:repressor LexA|nr:MAG TPA: helix-turn-helix domain protein [Caudoviricetes sp.]